MTKKLTHLRPGETAVISALEITEELLHRRFCASGFRVGKSVQLLRSALGQGPLHVRIGTTEVMLRRSDALQVECTSA